jgi:hypothetical protein
VESVAGGRRAGGSSLQPVEIGAYRVLLNAVASKTDGMLSANVVPLPDIGPFQRAIARRVCLFL